LTYDIAAKTGTVASFDGNSDAWCALYTTSDTLCVWQGNASMKRVSTLDASISGGSYPTVMARQILANLYKNPPSDFVMPFSIKRTAFDAFSIEKDHNLMLAGEYTPQELIHFDLAPEDTVLSVSEYFTIPKVDGFEVTDCGSCIEITFNAMKYYRYELIRTQDFKDNVIATIENKDEKICVWDIPLSGIALYKIIPYFMNEYEIKTGQPSVAKGILFTPDSAEKEENIPDTHSVIMPQSA
jgi:membrane carboxypeptidase/penicillin-binding protein PbpC